MLLSSKQYFLSLTRSLISASVSLMALTSATDVSAAPFTPRSNWVKTYEREVTCFRNGVPIKCDVHYNEKEVTWKVHWKGAVMSTRYYARRGGNWFQETYSNGALGEAWELQPDRLHLVNKEGDSIRIFGLN